MLPTQNNTDITDDHSMMDKTAANRSHPTSQNKKSMLLILNFNTFLICIGKEPSIWDDFTHTFPNKIKNTSNSDISCDGYKKIDEDVELLKNLGVNIYKFSISWSRIVNDGKMNHQGLEHYNKLIDALISHDISPMVTLFHWDTPQSIQSIGAWLNPYVATLFVEYARLVFEIFGNRVKYWITFNDPLTFCLRSYTDANFPPVGTNSKISIYLCSYVVLKSHAAVYRLYENSFKYSQNGLMSINLGTPWFVAETTNEYNVKFAKMLMEFTLGQFAEPIFGNGNYPKIMRDKISTNSMIEKMLNSKLPKFTKDEIETINNSADFFALNYYTSITISNNTFSKDIATKKNLQNLWDNSVKNLIKSDAESLEALLNYIKSKYGNIPIFIVENGYPDTGIIEDYERTHYIQTHLNSVLNAIFRDEINVIGYNVRSFLDSFEWTDGYRFVFNGYSFRVGLA
ncbi:myrosinase 1-like [Onthophagus taurus]|uniref:myrosinase 1-like n=1 Tax=Onthophagus taurus TaxID=166361 RepID=UPI0039BE3776